MTSDLDAKILEKAKIRARHNRKFKARATWFQRGQRRCYCGVQLNWTTGFKNSATVEHLVPSSQGGTYHEENLLVSCSSCNAKRGNESFIKFVESQNYPKKEWLIKKYLEAVEFYKKKEKKLGGNIYKNAEQYSKVV